MLPHTKVNTAIAYNVFNRIDIDILFAVAIHTYSQLLLHRRRKELLAIEQIIIHIQGLKVHTPCCHMSRQDECCRKHVAGHIRQQKASYMGLKQLYTYMHATAVIYDYTALARCCHATAWPCLHGPMMSASALRPLFMPRPEEKKRSTQQMNN